jgi:bifunctional ADP-heptose synthase (sugar kinase/adenylyltransferase)
VASDDDLAAVGHALLTGMQAQGILITRGSHGMALFERDGSMHLLPVPAETRREVRDATGAGDTVAAAFTLALAAGATLLQAAHLSNIAAGLKVRKFGVATVSAAEILATLGGTA